MLINKIDLYKYFGLKRKKGALGYLTTYIIENSPEINMQRVRPAMIVLPGGGYQFLSDRENQPIALKFNSLGYNTFVLEYSIKNISYPTQLIEACMAVAYVRLNAEALLVDPEHIGMVGFSAGGHLCASVATLYNDENVKKALKENADKVIPNAVILSYPVITSEEKYWERTSIENISGGKKSLMNKLSLEKRVTGDSVPAFIWHTKEDGCVPAFNSLLYAAACQEHGVPYELHVFERGPHGLSLATVETSMNELNKLCNYNASKWVELADNWLKVRGFKVIN